MKKIAIFFIVIAALMACEKEPGSSKLDPAAPVYISGSEAVTDAKGQDLLSVKEVIKQSNYFVCNHSSHPTSIAYYTIDGVCERDTVNNRIVGYSAWVITAEGSLSTEFIESRNFLLINYDWDTVRDTLGYIPNSVMIAAETAIKAAYEEDDYEECYRLFQEAFVFYPTTGERYLQLVEEGLN